jgi:predicted nucleotidyltransferase
MTDDQQALLDQLTTALGADPRVRSVWLSGSLGRGQGDAWSDVDLAVVVEEPDLPACLADYQGAAPDLPELVLSKLVHGRLVTAITPDWRRFDLAFMTPAELARQDGASLRPVLGETAAPPPPHPPATDSAAGGRVGEMIAEFIRVLGLAPVVIGRGEWLVAQEGHELLRKMLVDLMLEENGVLRSARGAKRLNSYLSAEQRAELEALGRPAAQREALIAANGEVARLFLPRAKTLAGQLGVEWPAAFEAATREHLWSTLSLEI